MSIALAPSRTSYFSITTFLDHQLANKTGIALDIVRKYYYLMESQGLDVRLHGIEGYGELVSFEELCLGAWMVFDKLYGPYPPKEMALKPLRAGLIGWNGPYSNPTMHIPMALKIYDDLIATSASRGDKISKQYSLEKWFRCNPNEYFTTFDNYEALESQNKTFYDWVLKELADVKTILDNVQQETTKAQDCFFDIKPFGLKYDTPVKVKRDQLSLINDAVIAANRLYSKFLTSMEQILYSFTKQQFPVKLFGSVGFLFSAYMKILVRYFKPYHAHFLEVPPIFNVEPESVNIGETFTYKVIKRLVDSVVTRVFDLDKTRQPYDTFPKVRENVKKIITAHEEDNITPISFFDIKDLNVDCSDLYLYTDDLTITNVNKSSTLIWDGSNKTDWNFWIDKPIYKYNNLDFNSYTKTLTNRWNRDVVLISNEGFNMYSNVTPISFENYELIASPNVYVMFKFTNFNKMERDYKSNIDGWYVYNYTTSSWIKTQLPHKIRTIGSKNFIDGTKLGETLSVSFNRMNTLMPAISNLKSCSIQLALLLPKGSEFRSLTLGIKSDIKLY